MKTIIGKQFGKLKVIKYHSTIKNRKYYFCICDCGGEKVVNGTLLKNGTTSSCGCLKHVKSNDIDVRMDAIQEPHGKSRTYLYKLWIGMKNRCNNSNNYSYKKYGGRGIKVCDSWNDDYLVFKKWALKNGYDNGLSIDRIDNNGNYEPTNCRWADIKEQSNNTSKNVSVEFKGMTKNLSQWAEYFDINYNNITAYVARGNTHLQAIEYYYNKHM